MGVAEFGAAEGAAVFGEADFTGEGDVEVGEVL